MSALFRLYRTRGQRLRNPTLGVRPDLDARLGLEIRHCLEA